MEHVAVMWREVCACPTWASYAFPPHTHARALSLVFAPRLPAHRLMAAVVVMPISAHVRSPQMEQKAGATLATAASPATATYNKKNVSTV